MQRNVPAEKARRASCPQWCRVGAKPTHPQREKSHADRNHEPEAEIHEERRPARGSAAKHEGRDRQRISRLVHQRRDENAQSSTSQSGTKLEIRRDSARQRDATDQRMNDQAESGRAPRQSPHRPCLNRTRRRDGIDRAATLARLMMDMRCIVVSAVSGGSIRVRLVVVKRKKPLQEKQRRAGRKPTNGWWRQTLA